MNDAEPVRDIEHFEHGRGDAEQLALLDAAGALSALAERFTIEHMVRAYEKLYLRTA